MRLRRIQKHYPFLRENFKDLRHAGKENDTLTSFSKSPVARKTRNGGRNLELYLKSHKVKTNCETQNPEL